MTDEKSFTKADLDEAVKAAVAAARKEFQFVPPPVHSNTRVFKTTIMDVVHYVRASTKHEARTALQNVLGAIAQFASMEEETNLTGHEHVIGGNPVPQDRVKEIPA